MSKNNNVNPSQYTEAGRERQGEEVVHEREKAKESINQQEQHGQREQAGQSGATPRSKSPEA